MRFSWDYDILYAVGNATLSSLSLSLSTVSLSLSLVFVGVCVCRCRRDRFVALRYTVVDSLHITVALIGNWKLISGFYLEPHILSRALPNTKTLNIRTGGAKTVTIRNGA
jgi:hypothetical protein